MADYGHKPNEGGGDRKIHGGRVNLLLEQIHSGNGANITIYPHRQHESPTTSKVHDTGVTELEMEVSELEDTKRPCLYEDDYVVRLDGEDVWLGNETSGDFVEGFHISASPQYRYPLPFQSQINDSDLHLKDSWASHIEEKRQGEGRIAYRGFRPSKRANKVSYSIF